MTTATEAPALGPVPHAALASVPVTLAMPACAACCALPLLVGAGMLTARFAAAVNQILIAAAIAGRPRGRPVGMSPASQGCRTRHTWGSCDCGGGCAC